MGGDALSNDFYNSLDESGGGGKKRKAKTSPIRTHRAKWKSEEREIRLLPIDSGASSKSGEFIASDSEGNAQIYNQVLTERSTIQGKASRSWAVDAEMAPYDKAYRIL